jgi:hypothetical protein
MCEFITHAVTSIPMTRAHLNGSINLRSAEEALTTVGRTLGHRVARVPDGETTRPMWVNSMVPFLEEVTGLELVERRWVDAFAYEVPTFRLRPGTNPGAVDFGPVEYADTALAGYRAFARVREAGLLPRTCRFQMSLPTPTGLISFFVEPGAVDDLLPVVAAHLGGEITRLLEHVPARDLAVQWDVAPEMAFMAGTVPGLPTVPVEVVTERMRALAAFVPTEVELGFHLCYGDPRPDGDPPGRQVLVPEDTGFAVSVIDAIDAAVDRTVDWFSIPVPADQALDDAYFRPLAGLRTGPDTEIQLGLVDDADGLAGSLRRAELARPYLPEFGVGTVCGLGRRHPSAIGPVLDLHRELIDALAPTGVPR